MSSVGEQFILGQIGARAHLLGMRGGLRADRGAQLGRPGVQLAAGGLGGVRARRLRGQRALARLGRGVQRADALLHVGGLAPPLRQLSLQLSGACRRGCAQAHAKNL
jgi:hypothetical protein